MNCTASSYFIPHSMRAKATKTGALERWRNPIELFMKREREKKRGEDTGVNAKVHMVP